MADNASSATQPSESDFHDSHPLEDDLSPSLGDLTDIDALPDEQLTDSKAVGDIAAVDSTEEDDVLGDITLLEEAFAEMADDDQAEATEDQNSAAPEPSIPVLDDSVEEPTGHADPNSIHLSPDESVPVLEQQATLFTESNPDSKATADEIAADGEPAAAIEGDSALEALLAEDEISEVSQAMAEDASVFAEPEDEVVSNISQFDQSATNFAEITTNSGLQTSVDALPSSAISDVSDSHVSTETVDDKIAQITGDNVQTEVKELPISQPVTSFSAVEDEDGPFCELPSGFASDSNNAQSSAAISNIQHEPAVSQPTHAEHQVSVGDKSGFAINIPFELHTQLSQKIDELVIDATTSLTNELYGHLSDRLEILLGQAVESVIPSLVDQMVNGLRVEVKQRVKDQLPVIINEVLGKTSLKNK